VDGRSPDALPFSKWKGKGKSICIADGFWGAASRRGARSAHSPKIHLLCRWIFPTDFCCAKHSPKSICYADGFSGMEPTLPLPFFSKMNFPQNFY